MVNRYFRGRFFAILVLGGLAVALAACGGGDDSEGGSSLSRDTGWDNQGVTASVADAPFLPRILNSPNGLGVGTNRLAVALFLPDDTLVIEADVTAYVYRLAQDPVADPDGVVAAGEFQMVSRTLDVHEDHQHADPGVARLDLAGDSTRPVAHAKPRGDAPLLPAHEDALTTVFTTMVEFDQQGWWGVSLDVTTGGETYRDLRMVRFVVQDPPMPIIGDPAVAVEQLTLADVGGDPREVSTAAEPIEAMLDTTIAESIQNGRPTVIAFVTPAFCQTRFCGPVLDAVVKPVWEQYGDQVDFIHVEPYVIEVARTQGLLQPVQAVFDWGLESEPFIYVVDASGRVSAALEGITDEGELRDAVTASLE